MKPEVLAWALLFVVAFGIVYRLFSWVGQRFSGAEADAGELKAASVSLTPAVSAREERTVAPPHKPEQEVRPLTPGLSPRAEAKETVEPSRPRPSIAATLAPPTERPLPQSVPLPAPARSIAARVVDAAPAPARPLPMPPMPAPPSAAAPVVTNKTVEPPKPLRPISVAALSPSAAIAVAAASAPPVARALSPDVKATLAPGASIREPAPVAAAASAPSVSQIIGTARPDVGATLEPRSFEAAKPETPKAIDVSPAPAPVKKRSARLRSRKIGEEAPSLDVRLNNGTHVRKLRALAKEEPKPALAKRGKSVKPKEKAPARLIGHKAQSAKHASAKAAMRIIGVPPRTPRIRIAAAAP